MKLTLMPKMTCESIRKVTINNFQPRDQNAPWRDQRLAAFVLTSTRCHFGGQRYWFVCANTHEGKKCGRRVGVLYQHKNRIACRYCFDLAYESQQRNHVGGRVFYRRFLADEKTMETAYMNMRVKNWHGQPTKRLRRWIERSDKMTLNLPRFLEAEAKVLGLSKSTRKRR